eukprot:TRINITY_DN787_c0_g1_i3.p1 TRINITY_DN787_c0_g1~~TRINITY_DN787_c0_g1_i3.p1  ORF type:complete len:371 (-),score=84.55 TRINITY_DN787_c0_g1_i3:108-1220(-)
MSGHIICHSSAPGKVILFGEHAIVYGFDAVAASLSDCRVESEIKLLGDVSSGSFITISGLTGEPLVYKLDNLNKMKHFKALDFHDTIDMTFISSLQKELSLDGLMAKVIIPILYAFNCVGLLGVPLQLSIIPKSLPFQSGLGSSAALAVSLCSCLLKLKQKMTHNTESKSKSESFDIIDLNEINQFALKLESLFHGSASGIDNTTSTFGGVNSFRKNAMGSLEVEKLEVKVNRILIINTGIQKDTKMMVEKVGIQYKEDTERVNEIFLRIKDASTRYLKFSDNSKIVHELIRNNQQCLEELGLANDEIHKIVNIGHKYGFETKITGAGGGGCMISMLSDKTDEMIHQFQDALKIEGFKSWISNIGGQGVK